MRLFHFCLFSACFLSCEAFHRVPPATINPPTSSPPGFVNTGPPDLEDNPAPEPSEQANTEWGVVKCNESESEYQLFNQRLQEFLSSIMDPRTVQAVDCTNREEAVGGMWIKGAVTFENGAVFDPSSSTQYLDVTSSSYIDIHIVGRDGQRITDKPLRMGASLYNSFIEGNSVTLAFQDQKGKVFLEGDVENEIFSGVFRFENFTTFQGGPGRRGSLARFAIYACSLLKC